MSIIRGREAKGKEVRSLDNFLNRRALPTPTSLHPAYRWWPFTPTSRAHPKQHVIMNSVLSLTGAAHRYRRKDFAAEIRVGER
jgi:hypothetical protein